MIKTNRQTIKKSSKQTIKIPINNREKLKTTIETNNKESSQPTMRKVCNQQTIKDLNKQ